MTKRPAVHLAVLLLLIVAMAAVAVAEDLTLTTYYPSPRGVYHELRTSGDTFLATTAGNVGVGTASPTAKLDVTGTVRIADGTEGADKILASDSTGFASWKNPQNIGVPPIARGSGTPNTVAKWGADPTTLVDTGAPMIDSGGNVGIGGPSAGAKLQVFGTARVNGFEMAAGAANNFVLTSDAAGRGTWQPGVPSGAVMFFNSANCPAGWNPLAAPDGVYIVTASAPSLGVVGTPLGPGENRPVGRHRHEIVDPGHAHGLLGGGSNDTNGSHIRGAGFETATAVAKTGITQTENHELGEPPPPKGTNAPYIRLRACQKN